MSNREKLPTGADLARRLLVGNKAMLFAAVFAAYLSFASPYFLTSTNVFALLDQIVVLTVVALGYTLVLGAGEIDLSIGGVVGLTGIVMGKLMTEAGLPVPVAILVGLGVGACCGALNATVISSMHLPPFIVTLATNAVFTGLIYITSNLVPISGLPEAFVSISTTKIGSIPLPVIILIPIAVGFFVIATQSVFGTHVVALGGSPEAVRVGGISVARLRLKIYVIAGICYSAAAVLLTARSASAQIGAGSQLLLLVIAAVVIGGTPLLGGRAEMVGTVFGCLIVGMISNGMNLLGVNANFQVIAQGVIILLALSVDVASTKALAGITKRRLINERRGRA